MSIERERKLMCDNRPAMTREQAVLKMDLFGEHKFRLEPFECPYCHHWHLRSSWKE